jgi:hypothetical protein
MDVRADERLLEFDHDFRLSTIFQHYSKCWGGRRRMCQHVRTQRSKLRSERCRGGYERRDVRASTGRHRNCDCNANSYADRDCNTDSYGHCHADSNRNCNCDAHSNADRESHRDANGQSDRDADSLRDGDCDCDCDCDRNPDRVGHSNGLRDGHAGGGRFQICG